MTKMRIVIGVSKLSPNYAKWLNQLHTGLELVDFYALGTREVPSHFHTITGLLLTGGGDVDPSLYDRAADLPYCRDVDAKRDKLETVLIELAFKLGIPLLGICRGQQMLNVVRHGSLYPDIPAFFHEPLVHYDEKGDVMHMVTVDTGSRLYMLTHTAGGMVNSSHHQAVNRIGNDFKPSAFSSDGLIEAIELDRSVDHPFCMAVQWHPERMDIENPMSGLLGKGFIEAVMNR